MGQTAMHGISNNARIIAGYAEAMVKGIPAERFARFGAGPAGPVVSNHPAWVFGHLSLYPGRAAGMLGVDADLAVPDGWEALFGPQSQCADDADGSRYPRKDELVDRMLGNQRRIAEVLLTLDDELLSQPTPVERYRERFPTIMCAANFLLTAHAMVHLGQLSAWRRLEGLGSAM